MRTVLFFWWLLQTRADNPCDYLSTLNGVINANVHAVCLGAPCAVSAPGLYLGFNVSIGIGDWQLTRSQHGLALRNGTIPLLICDYERCFTGSELPASYLSLNPGFYSGAVDYRAAINGVWFSVSQVQFLHATGVGTVTNVYFLADPSLTGVMWTLNTATYVFTNEGMLIVGNASTAAILANRGDTSVLAEGPIVLNTVLLTNSCRPGQLLVPLPPVGLSNILSLKTYQAPSTCGSYAYRDERSQTLYLDANQCYSIASYPLVAATGGVTAFKIPNLCPLPGSTSPLVVQPYVNSLCTDTTLLSVVSLPLGSCTSRGLLQCYHTL